MIAFANTQKTKAELLVQVREHRRLDQIAQKVYFEQSGKEIRACLIGCMVHGSDHALLEPLYGIPQSIGRIADGIFEGCPFKVAVELPVRFVEAIPEGADLSQVTPRFLLWLMEDPEGMRQFADEAGLAAIDRIAGLYRRNLEGDEPSIQEWESAARSARAESAAESAESAAESAAWSAWSAAESARSAARSAAWSAESAARSAAWSAESAAESAAQSAARIRQSEKLLELLASAPVSEVSR